MILDGTLFDKLTEEAKQSPRLRTHYNLHESLDAKAQRLLVALEPGTVMPIHRHPLVNETQMIFRGSMKVVYYNDQHEVVDTFELDPKKGNHGIHIQKGQWHTIDVLESGTIILEVKDGPYTPSTPEDIMNL